jgi:hypothetical protein
VTEDAFPGFDLLYAITPARIWEFHVNRAIASRPGPQLMAYYRTRPYPRMLLFAYGYATGTVLPAFHKVRCLDEVSINPTVLAYTAALVLPTASAAPNSRLA